MDKNPGVCPIGICEVIRRIIGKAVLGVIGDDFRQATGCAQPCAGQLGGIEATIHAMREIYQDDDTEAVVMVDAVMPTICHYSAEYVWQLLKPVCWGRVSAFSGRNHPE